MASHEFYMRRCLDLAKLGGKEVLPNPRVGAVLVHKDQIIGEGYHKRYGGAHAEIHAFKSVQPINQEFISESTLYVSLEPCCIHGKTPPCVDEIINLGIKKVFVGCLDPNPSVNGKGIEYLKANNVHVEVSQLEKEVENIIYPFKIHSGQQRAFVICKFAQSSDRYISKEGVQSWLSNKYSSIYSHKLRSEMDAIMIGTETALIDNPKLTVRNYEGSSPIRIVFDHNERIPKTHFLLSDDQETWIISKKESYLVDTDLKRHIRFDGSMAELLNFFFEEGIYSILLEGGAQLIKSFKAEKVIDEVVVINTPHILESGIKAPHFEGVLISKTALLSDEILRFRPIYGLNS